MWLLCCIRITIKKSVNTPESEEQLINLRKGTIRGACERRVSLFHEEEKICAVSPGGMWMCTELLKTPKAETRTATATARFSTVEETVSVFEYFSTTERDWEHGSFHINSKQVLSKQYVHTGEVTSNKRTQLCECEAVFFFFSQSLDGQFLFNKTKRKGNDEAEGTSYSQWWDSFRKLIIKKRIKYLLGHFARSYSSLTTVFESRCMIDDVWCSSCFLFLLVQR